MAKAKKKGMTPGMVVEGDCLQLLKDVPDESVPLIILDSPYNQKRKYDNYDDNVDDDKFLNWFDEVLSQCKRVLTPDGTLWVMMTDNLVSDIDVMARRRHGFIKRRQVVWAFTFGVNQRNNFTRSHTYLLYYTKHRKNFTFNAEDPAVRVPSSRQLKYKDKRANPHGRLPDDLWVLRKEELEESLVAYTDTWLINRICGTYKERIPEVDNRLPEELVARMIRFTSKPGDLVLDPFAGTATIGVVAERLGRQYAGMELSPRMVTLGNQRLKDRRKTP